MSSIERRQEQQQTYWCDECDMSIHLLITSIPSGDYSPICPHCQSHNLELMDGDDPAITTQTILTDTTSITSFFLLDSLFLTLFNDDINSSSSSSSSSLNDVFDTILPTIKITEASLLEGELEDVCAVCKEEFVIEVDDAKILPCNHLFHPHCILPWLTSNHTSCPLCRFHLLLPTTTDDDDDDDCSFPDVGTLSSFLPSHF